MGLFGKLKDAVGIGSLKAEIRLNVPGINPGENISGNVVLSGAASDVKITSVLFQLVNFGVDIQTTEVITDDYYYGTQWDTYEKQFKYQTVLFEQYLAQDFTMAKGQNLELPFDITTPADMYASDKQNRYVLKIHVDIPGQIDAKCAKRGPEAWVAFAGATSWLPFRAVLQGRVKLTLKDLSWWRLGVAIVIHVIVSLFVHEWLFGVAPLAKP